MKPPLLYLVHRIPYPPNKGDKLRSFHLLQYLCEHYSVHLGTFVDYVEDWQYVDTLKSMCASVHAERIHPARGRLASLRGLFTGEALSLPYYRSAGMREWVSGTVKQYDIRQSLVFCSTMAQYVEGFDDLHVVTDFVDVDSAKWTRYAQERRGLMAWLYAREGRRLADFEAQVARKSVASVLVSEAEAELFRGVAPDMRERIHAIGNGVDAQRFSPAHPFCSPYPDSEQAIVFTGAMDYWPNIDAVCSFADEIWPAIMARNPAACFYIVGMNPAETVRALATRPGIRVTGTVPDVRPWLRFAKAVVAPLRVARGVQNKILEAMAMAKPVIASSACAVGIDAERGSEFLVAADTAEWVSQLEALLTDGARAETIGARARARILSDYSWEAHLQKFGALLAS